MPVGPLALGADGAFLAQLDLGLFLAVSHLALAGDVHDVVGSLWNTPFIICLKVEVSSVLFLTRVVTVLTFSVFFGFRAFGIFVRVFFGLSGRD